MVKISNKISLVILITGISILTILSLAVYTLNRTMVIKSDLKHSEIHAKELSDHINRFLFEKVKMVMMMATSRVIQNALEVSNLSYADLPLEKRNKLKKRLNAKWRSIKEPTDQFILEYTDNKISQLLKAKQTTIKGEFGEIFLTNKFGALVASTSKLSTFTHGHKYWWLGSYNNGNGAVFFDDRGYDDSVGGYVLGLVIPIKKDDQIIGILKCNLNIMHSVNELISNMNYDSHAEFKLVRSGGLIVFEEGAEPMIIRVHDTIFQKLKSRATKSFIINDSDRKYLIGLSEIELTKKGGEGYAFGGTFESIDHKKGNTGESWYVLHYSPMSSTLSPVVKSVKSIGFIGALLIFFLGLVSFWFSKKITRPIEALNLATKQIGIGNFEYQIPEQQNDEFGELALSFNIMSNHLKETTITINALKNEINHRERIEKELNDSERRYRQMFETNPAIKLIINPEDSSIVEANNAACQFYGYSKNEITALKITDINVLSPAKVVEEMNSAKSENKLFFNFLHQLASGELRDVEVYSGPIQYGQATFLHSIVHDITERRRAEKKMSLSNRRYENLFRYSPVPLWEEDFTELYQYFEELRGKNVQNFREYIDTNPSFLENCSQKIKILDVNQEALKLHGAKNKEELLGNLDKIFTKKSFDTFKEEIIVLSEGKLEFEAEGEVKSLSGEKKIIALKLTIDNEHHESYRALIATMNISEYKQMEEKFRQSPKMESIGTLAGGIAHDFNNILSSIIGFSELALSNIDKGTELEDDIQEVKMAGMRAKDLVKQILTFARQSEEEVKPIQVNIIVKEVLKFIKSSIPSTIQINDKVNSDSIIMGSQTQIHQVLMNLCTNAAQAMEDKGGILEVSVNDTTIDRTAMIPDLRPGEYIEIKVADTGMGIAPQHIHNIFEPYFTTKAVGEGTGMGLAVVHGIVENYGGQITVDSTIGKGTCFTIYLPITKKRKVHINAVKEDLPVGNENIMFVDDEASIAKMGSRALEQLGYAVTARTSSVEALELFKSKPQAFDLVVTDMTMPNMTGDQLAGELMKIRSDIPVVLCTGYSK